MYCRHTSSSGFRVQTTGEQRRHQIALRQAVVGNHVLRLPRATCSALSMKPLRQPVTPYLRILNRDMSANTLRHWRQSQNEQTAEVPGGFPPSSSHFRGFCRSADTSDGLPHRFGFRRSLTGSMRQSICRGTVFRGRTLLSGESRRGGSSAAESDSLRCRHTFGADAHASLFWIALTRRKAHPFVEYRTASATGFDNRARPDGI